MRQLAAIMFSDIVGYTAIMGEDHDTGLALLHKNREIQQSLIKKHNGRFLKEMGDGILAQFTSAIDSVYCALDIQNSASSALNAKIRIGIHLGDVTIENEDIFGDGVNIASRLQSITDPGGIYLSQAVYELIRSRKDIHCELLGDIKLKNVDHPVRTYFVKAKELPVPSVRKKIAITFLSRRSTLRQISLYFILALIILVIIITRIWLPGTKYKKIQSLAVLPVENYTGNEAEHLLMAGIHNGLIDEMSRIREIRVVPRRSTLKYETLHSSVFEIATELDVQGIVEASINGSENNLNIQVRLIQTFPEEKQIWNKSYPLEIQKIFSTYCQVARDVASQINIKLSPEEEKMLTNNRTVDPEAYEAYLIGMTFWGKLSESDLQTAMQYFEKAKKIDPEFALAYAGIAFSWGGLLQGGYVPYTVASPKLEDAFRQALIMDSTLTQIHYQRAVFNTWYFWNWDIAEKEFKRTLKLEPNNVEANAYYSHYLAIMGKPDQGLPYSKRAVDLDKIDTRISALYGMALRHSHRPAEAVKILNTALTKSPNEIIILSTLRSAYHDLHMEAEAINVGKLYYKAKGDIACIDALDKGFREGGYKLALQRNAEELINLRKEKFVPTWQIATLYTRAGKKNEALFWLEKAYDEHDGNMPYINADPIFENLRDDPRFITLLGKMNLQE